MPYVPYYQVEDKIVDDAGNVAMQHRTSNPTAIKVGNTTYQFFPKKNVSLSWVKPEHVPTLLREQARICCGQKSNKFFLASLINVNIWTYGTRTGEPE